MKIGIAGYSGLVGGELMETLLADERITAIQALGRSAPPKSPKVRFIKSDFEDLAGLSTALSGCQAVFCCLGTTIKTAGSKEAFRKVDYTFVIHLAKAAKAAGASQFAVISAVGVSADSSVFYNKVKGEMEAELLKVGLEKVYIMKPSLLLGNREEFRLGERIGAVAMRLISPLMLGGLSKYKPIQAAVVAKAMHEVMVSQADSGQFHYKEMAELAK